MIRASSIQSLNKFCLIRRLKLSILLLSSHCNVRNPTILHSEIYCHISHYMGSDIQIRIIECAIFDLVLVRDHLVITYPSIFELNFLVFHPLFFCYRRLEKVFFNLFCAVGWNAVFHFNHFFFFIVQYLWLGFPVTVSVRVSARVKENLTRVLWGLFEAFLLFFCFLILIVVWVLFLITSESLLWSLVFDRHCSCLKGSRRFNSSYTLH